MAGGLSAFQCVRFSFIILSWCEPSPSCSPLERMNIQSISSAWVAWSGIAEAPLLLGKTFKLFQPLLVPAPPPPSPRDLASPSPHQFCSVDCVASGSSPLPTKVAAFLGLLCQLPHIHLHSPLQNDAAFSTIFVLVGLCF